MTNMKKLLLSPVCALALVALSLVLLILPPALAVTQEDIIGPAGSGKFGDSVTALPNGNVVVVDPEYDDGATSNVGAVYLYNGATGALISTLTGSTANDRVGYNDVTVFSNGNYVVVSETWINNGASNAGAVTWCSGTTGCTGVVSTTNSLVGSTADDGVGGKILALANGNYVVSSGYWDNGGVQNVGAATWCDGTTGCISVVSTTNSLVGSTAEDRIGSGGLVLTNGNYVVASTYWANGGADNAGAVTWGDGTTGVTGTVSASNSLVGSTADDRIGWAITALTNGNYVVASPRWDNGGVEDVGAATWCDGTAGCTGLISTANSLLGSTADDEVGGFGVTALTNGHYVVCSRYWDNGGADNAGAVTWGDGTTGITGTVSASNSLVGATADDGVGYGRATALSNGNYVVVSPLWINSGVSDAGAVTWGDGTTGITGTVSASNSLVGSQANDVVGYGGVTALTNGHYVVNSYRWANGGAAQAGATTWGDGTTGITGVVSTTNSLVGSTADDKVGYYVVALTNGNYVVDSYEWDNGGVLNAGAATWCDGTAGCTGVVTTTNSLVGTTADDRVGSGGVRALSNGDYAVISSPWDNGGIQNAGAVTWGDGAAGTPVGPISADNSVLGEVMLSGFGIDLDFDATNEQIVIGWSMENAVTLYGRDSLQLTLTKSVNPATAKPGEAITYTIAFSNTGAITATNVIITDTLSAHITAASYSSSGVALTQVPGSHYVWSAPDLLQGDGGTITITGVLTKPLAAGTIPNTVTLAVSGTVKTANKDLTVENVAPVAVGVDHSTRISETATLDGSGSYDDNGDALTYGWAQTGGAPTVTLSDPAAQQPTFTAPGAETVLTFTLTVTDTGALTDTDEVVVSVVEDYIYYFPLVFRNGAP